jgi:hypothetical protein
MQQCICREFILNQYKGVYNLPLPNRGRYMLIGNYKLEQVVRPFENDSLPGNGPTKLKTDCIRVHRAQFCTILLVAAYLEHHL